MRLVINHLTRMQKGCMCVAGIDLQSRRHIRPVLERQLTNDLLAAHGGPFEIGRILDLGETRFVGKLPEVEDQLFVVSQVRHGGDMHESQFWELLEDVAHDRLASIFGTDLKPVGQTCAVEETHGLRSLGCYWAIRGRLFVTDSQSGRRIKFRFESEIGPLTIPVTDIRLFESDHVTPCESTVEHMATRIAATNRMLISLGLSRSYRKSADDPPRHWLQLNNLHFRDLPCWRLVDRFCSTESGQSKNTEHNSQHGEEEACQV